MRKREILTASADIRRNGLYGTGILAFGYALKLIFLGHGLNGPYYPATNKESEIKFRWRDEKKKSS